MKLKNILLVVADIEQSKKFYHDLFGLDVILDNDGAVILTEGLVLQDREIWKRCLGQDVICLLYTSPSPRDRTRSRMPSSA